MTVSTQNALHALDNLVAALKADGLDRFAIMAESARKCTAGITAQHALMVQIKDIQNVFIKTGETRGQKIGEFQLTPLALPGHKTNATDRIVFGDEETIEHLRNELAELARLRREKADALCEGLARRQKEKPECQRQHSTA